MNKGNIFPLKTQLPLSTEQELLEQIGGSKNIIIERIVSTGQQSPPDFWYEQEKTEWVILLQGAAKLLLDTEDGEVLVLKKGDYVEIPAMRKHRVIYTSEEPACVWLAVHFNA